MKVAIIGGAQVQAIVGFVDDVGASLLLDVMIYRESSASCEQKNEGQCLWWMSP